MFLRSWLGVSIIVRVGELTKLTWEELKEDVLVAVAGVVDFLMFWRF